MDCTKAHLQSRKSDASEPVAFDCNPVLLSRCEVGVTVALVAFLSLVGTDRTLFTVADGLQFVGGNTQPDQRFLGLRGAAIAQSKVVLG